MAGKLADLFPAESGAVSSALGRCVVYNRHNSDINLCGLSSYYIYGGKKTADKSLSTYAALRVEGDYSSYLHDFSEYLTASPFAGNASSSQRGGSRSVKQNDEILSSELTAWMPLPGERHKYYMVGIKQNEGLGDTTLWPRINGVRACAYKIDNGQGRETFAVPVSLNGENADIIIAVCKKYPQGRILGARKEQGFIVQKGCDEVKEGDKIAFYYEERGFEERITNNEKRMTKADMKFLEKLTTDNLRLTNKDKGGITEEVKTKWHKSKEITVKGGLKLDWARVDGAYFSVMQTDTQNNKHYSGLFEQRITQSA